MIDVATSAPVSSAAPHIYDEPLAINRWPAITVYYMFALVEEKPHVQLRFYFDPTQYVVKTDIYHPEPTPKEAEALKNKIAADLDTYLKIYYQLSSTTKFNVTLHSSIENTIDADKKPVVSIHTIDTTELTNTLIIPVIDLLRTLTAGGRMPLYTNIPTPATVSVPVNTTALLSLPSVMPLTVTAAVQRLEAATVAKQAAADIQPLLASNTGMYKPGMPGLDYFYFVTKFETTFVNRPNAGITYKIATQPTPGYEVVSTKSSLPMWIVRFDDAGKDGLKYSFDGSQQHYFAPPPLSTSLHSFSGPLKMYATGEPFPAGYTDLSFYDIDLDVWARQFLAALDAFLKPNYAVPAFLLYASNAFDGDPNYLQVILDARRQLADIIKDTVEPVIGPANVTPANLDNAKERWKEHLLVSLSDAMDYATLAQTAATISWEFNQNDMAAQSSKIALLHGEVTGQNTSIPDTGYSFSQGVATAANHNSHLAFMLDAKAAAAQHNISFESVQYSLNQIELDMQDAHLAGISNPLKLSLILPYGYISTGLPLISEPKIEPVGKMDIPVALRRYPTTPTLSAQDFAYPLNGPNPPGLSIANARKWNYYFSYITPLAAQDCTEIELYLDDNRQPAYRAAEKPGITAFCEALTQFVINHPGVSGQLDNMIRLTEETITSTSIFALQTRYALLAFIETTQEVIKQWAALKTAGAGDETAAGQNVLGSDLSYRIHETCDPNSKNLVISTTANRTLPGYDTAIDIPGYIRKPGLKANTYQYCTIEDGTEHYLSYENRATVAERVFTLAGLDAMKVWGMYTSITTIRNKYLVENKDGSWQPTNENFIYTLPKVSFRKVLAPLLESDTAIDISTITTVNSNGAANRTLLQHCTALFEALTENWEIVTKHSIQLTCDYSYELPGTGLVLTIPVTILPKEKLEKTDKGGRLAAGLENALTTWFASRTPELNAGRYNFMLTVFHPDTDNPLMKLPLYLELSRVK